MGFAGLVSLSNCSAYALHFFPIRLGGKEKTTLKEISEILGKETIDSFNTSETRGRELSHGLNYQKLGKQLMPEDEIAVMDLSLIHI